MARWTPDARSRLAKAALALYIEHGFEQTTVAEIAGRAGLTERTFFRHFADKREVLFGGSAVLEAGLVAAVAQVPDGRPLDMVVAALETAGTFFMDDRRAWAGQRQGVIEANTSLMERELIKLHALGGALAGALVRRGVPEPAATLGAQAGLVVFWQAFGRWCHADPPADWGATVRQVHRELGAVITENGPPDRKKGDRDERG
ncbi:TetR/AcrR family transcriptional regulator [Deinococcus sp. Leaf326]|uniref:TetR/AcrR family transcriptional regulator n=1 Tax=Deinococcus sp. Leaf326 TaxID=1736338 RepID=UPI0006F82857|nr:TetR/AcrR family transcriptional regulator [Deinococcus sp. Leaf326]KQR00995.1 TetR family transcriptional regulator [Deinococcus sp. Leaf326]